MKKTYNAPAVEELGAVSALTAAFGVSPRADFSEFAAIPSTTGSFDVCDSDQSNNQPGEFCGPRSRPI